MTGEGELAVSVLWTAGQLWGLARGDVVFPRLLIDAGIVQNIGNGQCSYARTDIGPGEELEGGILTLELPDYPKLVYRLSRSSSPCLYLAQWPD